MTIIVGLTLVTILQAPTAPSSLTPAAIAAFLSNAKIVHAKAVGKGVTSPWRLTLSDGTLTHAAAFQSVDEHKPTERLASGGTELNFIDACRHHGAAYR